MKNPASSLGTLYVVATPIGHLDDMTLRALKILKEVDYIAAEDTRQTRKLLHHYDLQKRMVSYYEHNEDKRTRSIINDLKGGKSIALVSSAGTPGISDPGYVLVRQCLDHNIPIVPIPGSSAIIAALSVAGLPTDRFQFVGFLSPKAGKKRKLLESLQSVPETLVFL